MQPTLISWKIRQQSDRFIFLQNFFKNWHCNILIRFHQKTSNDYKVSRREWRASINDIRDIFCTKCCVHTPRKNPVIRLFLPAARQPAGRTGNHRDCFFPSKQFNFDIPQIMSWSGFVFRYGEKSNLNFKAEHTDTQKREYARIYIYIYIYRRHSEDGKRLWLKYKYNNT